MGRLYDKNGIAYYLDNTKEENCLQVNPRNSTLIENGFNTYSLCNEQVTAYVCAPKNTFSWNGMKYAYDSGNAGNDLTLSEVSGHPEYMVYIFAKIK